MARRLGCCVGVATGQYDSFVSRELDVCFAGEDLSGEIPRTVVLIRVACQCRVVVLYELTSGMWFSRLNRPNVGLWC